MTSRDSGAERLPARLINACNFGKASLLEELLPEAREANQLTENTLSLCLQKASDKGHEKIVRTLLANGARTNIASGKGLAPLTRAAQRNHLNIVKILLEHGADPEATDRDGRTNLTSASLRNNIEVVKTLLANHANVNAQDHEHRNVLHILASDDTPHKLDADEEAQGKSSKKSRHPRRWGAEIIQVLLATGIDVDLQDKSGRTPIQWAAVTGKQELLSLLLSRPTSQRPNVHACNQRRKTALHLAAERGHLEACQVLLDHGADAMARSDGAWTPLHNAAEKGHSLVAKLVLAYGADINATTSSGMTALHWASQNGHLSTVEVLVSDKRASLNLRDTFESTPLLRAAQYQRKDIVSYLAHHIFDDRLLSLDAVNACKGFKATIVDFGAGVEKRNLVEKKSVYETVYRRESMDSEHETYAVTTLTRNIRSKPIFRWIHLPANNMAWVEALLTKHFLENEANDVEGFKALERSFVQCHRGPRVHSRFMRPMCQRISPHEKIVLKSADATEGSMNGRNTPSPVPRAFSTPNRRGNSRANTASPKPKAKDPPRQKGNIFLYMPYLHYEEDSRRHKMSRAIRDILSSDQDKKRKRPDSADELLVRAHVHSSTQLHIRRTLDQFYYQSIDTERRDRDQVVYRYCKEKKRERKIFMVDQLWCWILGDGLIVTAFPQRWNQPDNDPLNVLDGIIEDMNSKTRPPVRSVYDLAQIITGRCTGVFDRHRVGDEDYQFLDMFESSIGSVTDQETALFHEFNTASKTAAKWLKSKRESMRIPTSFGDLAARTVDDDEESSSDESDVQRGSESIFNDNLLDIGRETELLAECKDIRDELNIIHMILNQQSSLLKDDIPSLVCEEVFDPHKRGEIKRRYRDQQKLVDLHIKDVERMDKQAESIYQNLLHLLDLKQKHANAFEARFARDQASDTARQGQTIMIFTLVTIIFLPMSFMAAFFAIDVKEFPHDVNGTKSLTLGYVSKYMFGIGLAISIPLIYVAFTLDNIVKATRDAHRWINNIMGRRQKKKKLTDTGVGMETRSAVSAVSGIYGMGSLSRDITLEKRSFETDRASFIPSPVARVFSTGTEKSVRTPRISFQQDLERGT